MNKHVTPPIVLTLDTLPEHLLDPDDLTAGQTLLLCPPLAANEANFIKAEKLFLKVLQYELTEDERKNLLLELALMYDRLNNSPKTAMFYEQGDYVSALKFY